MDESLVYQMLTDIKEKQGQQSADIQNIKIEISEIKNEVTDISKKIEAMEKDNARKEGKAEVKKAIFTFLTPAAQRFIIWAAFVLMVGGYIYLAVSVKEVRKTIGVVKP